MTLTATTTVKADSSADMRNLLASLAKNFPVRPDPESVVQQMKIDAAVAIAAIHSDR